MGNKNVFYITGPPGAGKTVYLYEKLEELIKTKKAKPEEILVFVFNDKTTEELKKYILQYCSRGFSELWINTFPAFCKKILRDNYYLFSALSKQAYLSPNFQIIGGMEEKLVLKKICEDNSLNLKYYTKSNASISFVNEIVNFIDLMKQNLHKLKELKNEGGKFAELEKIFWRYNDELKNNDYLDLRDLTLKTIDLFEKDESVLEKYENKFKYILVDDFEEIDYQQFRLLKILCKNKAGIFVAGNSEESIFGFRGARPEEIKNKFISHFKPQKINLVSQENTPPCEIYPFMFDTDMQESFFIARKIYELIRNKKENEKPLQYKDVVVLSRQIGTEVNSLVNALAFYKIPYKVVGATGFMQPAIISLISVLHTIDKFRSKSLSNFHVIWALTSPNFCVDKVDLERIVTLSERKKEKLIDIIKKINSGKYPYLKNQTKEIIAGFVSKIEEFQSLKKVKSLDELMYKIYFDFGFLRQSSSDKKVAKQISHFNNILKKYQRIENHFSDKKLDFDSFITNLDQLLSLYSRDLGIQLDGEEDEDEVKIMTVQQAKGTFFEVVFVFGLVEGKFPRQFREGILLSNGEKRYLQLEPLIDPVRHSNEEKKMFQVAVSRAKDRLFLTYAKRYRLGGEESPSKVFLEFLKNKNKPFLEPEEKILTHDDLISVLVRNENLSELEEYIKEDKDLFSFYLLIKDKYVPSALYDKFRLPKDFYLTASKVKTYLECPAKFFFQYCLNIWVSPQTYFLFGRLVHRILEKLHNKYPTQEELNGKAGIEELNEIIEMVWQDEKDGFESNYENKIYKCEAKDILNRYLNLEKKRTFLKTMKCEMPLSWEKEGIKFKGRIDRIDIRKDDSLEVIDYKTSKMFSYQGDTLWKKWIEGKTDFQPIIYLLGARESIDNKICAFSIYWLKKNTGNDIKTTLELADGNKEMDCTNKKNIKYLRAEEIKDAEDKLLSVAGEIISGAFKEKPNYNTCRRCDFSWLCEGNKIN